MGDHDEGNSGEVRTRRRGQELIDAIHQAVLEEVAEVGLGRLTMEGIAKRAATARTTLYRRWNDPTDLLLEALFNLYPVEKPSPQADDLRGDLIRALRLLVEWMDTCSGRAVCAIFNDPGCDARLMQALSERVFTPRGGTFTQTVLRHYAANGYFDSGLITPVVTQIGEALVINMVTEQRTMPSEKDLANIVDQAILPAVGYGRHVCDCRSRRAHLRDLQEE
ncbi:TetR/AcrR family transcriptional regulator [Natronoglycomyces albus]|uniref:TetR/AcrR family transcriptional regulator n=1 Tax=Natronoglycomyces albus TaxID=2811108 RepID=A0A895XPJ5_9ACTN|nr:TetR/AcrR family transcriptional regulator [Natronoglycomyces albus]QSB04446.1 TetR/AcrR family transcriptional regulator [Natronoglycomyces albus]